VMSAQHAGQMPRGTDHRRRFTVLDTAALLARPRPTYLVEEVAVQGTLAVLYGPAGAGKSFVALDIAFSVVTGTAWHGHAVQPGAVVYIAAEGGGGLAERVQAWMTAHQITSMDDAWYVLGAVDLLDEDEVTACLAELAEIPVGPVLLIVDTLPRCLVGGDENSAKDMGRAVAALDRLRETLRCTVLVLHHTARHHDAERGSTALRGAADTMLAVTKDGDSVTIACAKQKDAADFDEIKLRMVLVGDSCVLELAPETSQTDGPTGAARTLLEVLAEAFDEDGASYTRWLKASRLDERTFGRARNMVIKKKWVEKRGERRNGRYFLTDAGRATLA
jgi:AAA domain